VFDLTVSTAKKVLIRRFEREPVVGTVSGFYLRPDGVELLTPDVTVQVLSYQEVKTVSFVKDFDAAEQETARKVFNTRPKTDGLWVRMTFRDDEVMEGILTNNLLQLEPYGFTVVPPDPYSNNQRIFVPKAALKEIQVLGVVGSPLRRRKPKQVPKEQIELFEG
jgi:hypothetical protein